MEMKRMLSVCLLLSLFAVCRPALAQTLSEKKPATTDQNSVDETDAGAPHPLTYAQQLEAEEQQSAAAHAAKQSQSALTPRDWGHARSYYPNTYYRLKRPTAAQQTPCDSHTHTVATSRSSINPDDVNYGGLFSIWHLHLVEDTLLSAEWWSLMCSAAVILILCLYIIWLHRQRDERYRITVDIVLQLVNAHRFARFHAHRVINKYNVLVDSLNAEYEEEMRSSGTALSLSTTSPIVAGLRSVPRPESDTKRSSADVPVDVVSGELTSADTEPYAISTAQYGLNGAPTSRSRPATDEVLAAANAAASERGSEATSVASGKDLAQENRMLVLQRSALEQRLKNTRRALLKARNAKNIVTTDGTAEDNGVYEEIAVDGEDE